MVRQSSKGDQGAAAGMDEAELQPAGDGRGGATTCRGWPIVGAHKTLISCTNILSKCIN
jgi:hypothetical protein